MLRSMYSGVAGMKGFQVKLDVIGNNIANVNTVGFKKGRVMFQDALSQNIGGVTRPEEGEIGGTNPRQVGLGVNIGSIDTIHTPGSPMSTGKPEDLLIEGDGFFLVLPPGVDDADGGALLTRAGNFHIDALGQLVTSQGYRVATEGGELIDPEVYKSIVISNNGEIIGVTEDDEIEVIDTLLVGFVNNPGGLRKVGGSFYQLTANAHPEGEFEPTTVTDAVDDGRVMQIIAGALEMSNVDLTEEFTEMIIAQRGFQANSRIITTSDEVLQEVVNLKR